MPYTEGQTTTDGSYTFRNGGWYKTPGWQPPAAPGPAKDAAAPAEPTPSTWEDIKNIAKPSLKMGGIAAIPGVGLLTAADFGMQGLNKIAPPGSLLGPPALTEEQRAKLFSPEGLGHTLPKYFGDTVGRPAQKILQQLADPSKPVPFSLGDIADKLGMEDPEAKTPGGRLAQTALEYGPGMFTGGSEARLLGKGAKGIMDFLPKASNLVSTAGATVGDWAANELSGGNPLTRMAGALMGGNVGPGIRRGRTPNPITDPTRAARVADVGQDVNLSAGQKVGGLTKSAEAWAGYPEEFQQPALGEQYSRGVMRRLGAPGAEATVPGSDAAKAANEQAFRTLTPPYTPPSPSPQYRATEMRFGNPATGTIDPDFDAAINQARAASTHPRPPGGPFSPRNVVDDFADRIKNGISGKGPVYGMGGADYQNIRGEIERAAAGTADPNIRTGLNQLRDALDNKMNASLAGGPHAGAWPAARQQFADWQGVNSLIQSGRAPEATLNPRQVRSQVSGTSPIGENAENFRLLTKKNPVAESWLPEVAGGAAGAWLGSHLGGEGATGGILGMMAGPTASKAARAGGRSILFQPGVQNWLGNQAWMPPPAGSPTALDPKAVARVLTTQQGIQNYEDTPYQ